jgi:hypothetical protein
VARFFGRKVFSPVSFSIDPHPQNLQFTKSIHVLIFPILSSPMSCTEQPYGFESMLSRKLCLRNLFFPFNQISIQKRGLPLFAGRGAGNGMSGGAVLTRSFLYISVPGGLLKPSGSGFLGTCTALIPHQGIICGVAFPRSSLRRIASYASVVAPRRLASDAWLVIRNRPKPHDTIYRLEIRRWIWVPYALLTRTNYPCYFFNCNQEDSWTVWGSKHDQEAA